MFVTLVSVFSPGKIKGRFVLLTGGSCLLVAKVDVMPKCISRVNYGKEKNNKNQDIIWENMS